MILASILGCVWLLGRPAAAWSRGGGPAPAAAPTMRLLALRGEVLIKRAGAPGDAFAPASAPSPIARRDEIQTRAGGAEVQLENGMVLSLAEDTLVALIGGGTGVDAYLARGAVRVVPGPADEVHGVQLVTGAGRVGLRGRDARVRADENSATVAVYDGRANTWGKGGVTIKGGQVATLLKGGAPGKPHPLLAAPRWLGADGIYLRGEKPAKVVLRWQAGAAGEAAGSAGDTAGSGAVATSVSKYVVEISPAAGGPPLRLTVEGPATSAELRELDVGDYAARVYAVDVEGVLGQPSEPRRLLLLGLSGLNQQGVVKLAAGTRPTVTAPDGVSPTVQVDGEALGDAGLRAGVHRLAISVAELSTEVTAKVPAAKEEADPNEQGRVPVRQPIPSAAVQRTRGPEEGGRPRTSGNRPDLSRPPLFAAQGTTGSGPLAAPEVPPYEVQPRQELAPVAPDEAAPRAPRDATSGPSGGAIPPGDILLGGPSEVPGGGVRSPWAGPLAQLRLETSTDGAIRVGVHGQYTLRNGLGGEVDFSALRLQPSDPLAGGASYGDLLVGLRSPALRRARFALQGVVLGTLAIGASGLDEGPVNVPAGVTSAPRRDGDFRVEPAVLFGLDLGRLTLLTQQGVSLRLRDVSSSAVAYEGGLVVEASATSRLRVLGMLQWNVGYPGVPLQAGDSSVEAGGAVGGGFQFFVPGPPALKGGFELLALGRAGMGDAGVAIYGRGMFGLQLGYRFR